MQNPRREADAVALRRFDCLDYRQTVCGKRAAHGVDVRAERCVAILEVRIDRVKRRIGNDALCFCKCRRKRFDAFRLIHWSPPIPI